MTTVTVNDVRYLVLDFGPIGFDGAADCALRRISDGHVTFMRLEVVW